MRSTRYIVVEGPIGVGKTSLAKILAEEFGAELALDPADENPFLRVFYEDPRRHGLATQLEFLLRRRERLHRIGGLLAGATGTPPRSVVSDFLFAKDALFARLTLSDPELRLYRELAGALAESEELPLPTPDLVVFLEARPEVLQQRLHKRDRDFERRIAPEYLASLSETYRNFFHSFEDAPLLVVNCSAIDFLGNGDQRVDLIREIRGVKHGVQHYIPLGSR